MSKGATNQLIVRHLEEEVVRELPCRTSVRMPISSAIRIAVGMCGERAWIA
jgi:hypothetical protein